MTTTRRFYLVLIPATLALAPLCIAAPAQESASPLVKQMYDGRWPDKASVAQMYNEAFYQNAIRAYILTLPTLNVIGMRDGSEAKFGKVYNVLPIWKDRMTAKTWVPTPNCDVVYSMSYLDLKETGPLVVYVPSHVIGMFTDFFQRTLTDVGAAGPDRDEGGLYLLLPPGYQGHVPGGYFTFTSRTHNVFLFFRTVLTQGPDGPDAKQAVAIAEQTRVYPLSAVEKDRKPMEFPNASNVPVNMMYPTDFPYWEKLKAYLDYEADDAFSTETRGVLAAINIVKGQPFTPTSDEILALTRAVETAPKMIFARRMAGRPDGRELIYKDRQYLNAWAGADPLFYQPNYLDIENRAVFFQMAYSSSPAMVLDMINRGSKYPSAMRDKDGDLLDGSSQYKLHLPTPIPAALYWSVTVYNPADGTLPQTSQPFPSRNRYDKPQLNADGSVDIYFGPTKPSDVSEKNWLQTLTGRAFMVSIRLYGAETAYYDQTWKPDDVVKLQ